MSANPLKKKQNDLEIGEIVKVKKGVMCPDYKGLCLENYHGIVTDLLEDESGSPIICLEWDSITLKSLPVEYISESIKEGLAYHMMYLSPEELERAEARDTEEDIMATQDEIHEKYKWAGPNGEGSIIRNVIKGISADDYDAQYKAWNNYMTENLVFPFDAEIAEYPEKGSLRHGDKIVVNLISFIDEQYGLVVEVKKGRNRYSVPLCDLIISDDKSSNYIHLNSYIIWFRNQ